MLSFQIFSCLLSLVTQLWWSLFEETKFTAHLLSQHERTTIESAVSSLNEFQVLLDGYAQNEEIVRQRMEIQNEMQSLIVNLLYLTVPHAQFCNVVETEWARLGRPSTLHRHICLIKFVVEDLKYDRAGLLRILQTNDSWALHYQKFWNLFVVYSSRFRTKSGSVGS